MLDLEINIPRITKGPILLSQVLKRTFWTNEDLEKGLLFFVQELKKQCPEVDISQEFVTVIRTLFGQKCIRDLLQQEGEN